MSESKTSDDEAKPIVAKTAIELQRFKLEKLMKNPDKFVVLPERVKEKKTPHVPEFVRNVMGSSAGAGSGEFHVYRHLRRKEYARQKFIQEKNEKELLEEAYHQKLLDNQEAAEEKTAKKRAKRLKKKAKKKLKKLNDNAKGKNKPVKEESSPEEESDSDEDQGGTEQEKAEKLEGNSKTDIEKCSAEDKSRTDTQSECKITDQEQLCAKKTEEKKSEIGENEALSECVANNKNSSP